MKVILKEEVTKLGQPGDVVNVSDGFARNYLFPQKKALLATPQNIKNIEQHKKSILKKLSQHKGQFEELAKKITEFTCTIAKKVGANQKLFGSVTSQDIHKVLSQHGLHIEKRTIELGEPLKALGNFQVPIKLHPEVTATLTVTVKAEE